MLTQINFVKERRKSITIIEQQDRKTLTQVSYGFIGVLVLLVIAIGVNIFFATQMSAIQQEQVNTKAAISRMEPVEREYTIFAAKLSTITQLWGQRQNKQEAISFFNQLFSSADTSLSRMSFATGTNQLEFGLRATSIFIMEQVFNVLTGPVVLDKYPNVTRETLSRGIDASYNVSVVVDLRSEAEIAAARAAAAAELQGQVQTEQPQVEVGDQESPAGEIPAEVGGEPSPSTEMENL